MATREELEIVLKIQAQNAELLDKVNTQFHENEASAAKLTSGLTLLGVGAVAASAAVAGLGVAFAKSLSELLEYTEGLEKANLSTGISIDFWQKLAKTGEEMDISLDSMRSAVERMEKALEGNGEALRKFGIETENFTKLDADEKLRAMAVQIMAIEDPTTRAAAAQAAFGRAGAELIPILAAIVNGSVDAQRVLGTDMVEALNRTDQSIDSAKTAWKGLQQSFVSFIALKLPLQEVFTSIADGLRMLSDTNVLTVLKSQWIGAMETLRTGNLAVGVAVMEAVRAGEKQTQQTRRTTEAELALTETTRKLRVVLGEYVDMAEKEEKASKRTEAQAAKQKKAREAEEKSFQRVEEAARKYAMESEAALIKSWNSTDAAGARHTRQMEEREEAELAAARRKWLEMARAATSYYQQDSVAASLNFFKTRGELAQTAAAAEEAYRRMLAAGTATFDELRAAHEAWKQAEADLNAKSHQTTLDLWMAQAEGASTILRSLFGKSKAAAIAAAIIDTIAAVVKTMAAYPWPWNLVPAAAAAAAGYAQVQKIRSTEAGFASGTPGTHFLDFGRGSVEVLHGEEAVVTRAQAESVASMVRTAIEEANRRGGGSAGAAPGGTEVIHVHVHLGDRGGKEIADAVVRRNKAGLAPMRVA